MVVEDVAGACGGAAGATPCRLPAHAASAAAATFRAMDRIVPPCPSPCDSTPRDARRSSIGVKTGQEVAQAGECFPAVAHLVLLRARDLAERPAERRVEEERVVSEAVLPAHGLRDRAKDGLLHAK